jgi:hypothetical protein
VKQQRKAKLAAMLKSQTGDDININNMFDIQVISLLQSSDCNA